MHKFTLQFKIYQDQLVNRENHVINNVTHRIVKDTTSINNLIAVVSNSVNLPHISTHKTIEVYKDKLEKRMDNTIEIIKKDEFQTWYTKQFLTDLRYNQLKDGVITLDKAIEIALCTMFETHLF